jgi:hypothetical protein
MAILWLFRNQKKKKKKRLELFWIRLDACHFQNLSVFAESFVSAPSGYADPYISIAAVQNALTRVAAIFLIAKMCL